MDRWSAARQPPKSSMLHKHGPWPTHVAGKHDFLGPHYGDVARYPSCDVLLPPCPEPWMVPAYLYAQPHNDLPDAIIQCAVLRSWYHRFGAEVVYTNGVVYEFAVGRPPESAKAAMELAREHYLFCPDRLDQAGPDVRPGAPGPGGSLEQLAAMLMVSSVWYFWWD